MPNKVMEISRRHLLPFLSYQENTRREGKIYPPPPPALRGFRKYWYERDTIRPTSFILCCICIPWTRHCYSPPSKTEFTISKQ